jgi:hypothetical protein
MVLVLAGGGGAGIGFPSLRAEPVNVVAADREDGVLYEDAAGRSSATITQVMPDASKSMMTLDKVRRIRVKHDILVIEWGDTVTTLLPRQYVGSVTINKRAPAATEPRG